MCLLAFARWEHLLWDQSLYLLTLSQQLYNVGPSNQRELLTVQEWYLHYQGDNKQESECLPRAMCPPLAPTDAQRG